MAAAQGQCGREGAGHAAPSSAQGVSRARQESQRQYTHRTPSVCSCRPVKALHTHHAIKLCEPNWRVGLCFQAYAAGAMHGTCVSTSAPTHAPARAHSSHHNCVMASQLVCFTHAWPMHTYDGTYLKETQRTLATQGQVVSTMFTPLSRKNFISLAATPKAGKMTTSPVSMLL